MCPEGSAGEIKVTTKKIVKKKKIIFVFLLSFFSFLI